MYNPLNVEIMKISNWRCESIINSMVDRILDGIDIPIDKLEEFVNINIPHKYKNILMHEITLKTFDLVVSKTMSQNKFTIVEKFLKSLNINGYKNQYVSFDPLDEEITRLTKTEEFITAILGTSVLLEQDITIHTENFNCEECLPNELQTCSNHLIREYNKNINNCTYSDNPYELSIHDL